jgi:uncharacterized protein YcbK (DUF882 family)
MPEQGSWEFFSRDELKCKASGECAMDEAFMQKLVQLRKQYGKPITLSSAYRSKEHNASVGGAPQSPHIYGKAVDIRVYGTAAYRIVQLALQLGFTGIGVSQKGDPAKRFIHLDTMESSSSVLRPTIWSY